MPDQAHGFPLSRNVLQSRVDWHMLSDCCAPVCSGSDGRQPGRSTLQCGERPGHRHGVSGQTRSHRLTAAEKEANRLVGRERSAAEHGFANVKAWRIFTKLRMNARHATTLLRALLVLANTEVQR
ncbi:hypothetical protein OHA88_42500 [Streptomyces sp. NBC_00353]|uniref:transposase family protein n=1 Tax=Streptomyces sp. NBC_00353 TaxID=2975722 RepID=UPI002E26A3E1